MAELTVVKRINKEPWGNHFLSLFEVSQSVSASQNNDYVETGFGSSLKLAWVSANQGFNNASDSAGSQQNVLLNASGTVGHTKGEAAGRIGIRCMDAISSGRLWVWCITNA